MLLVSEDDIELAILLLLEIEKTVVEGAGAVGLAALLQHRERFAGRHVGLVLCGGNIEPLVLAEIIQRGMVKSGRLVRLRCDVRDVPGALADVAAALGRLGANIDEVQHQRAFTTLSVERALIEVVVQTRGAAHVEEILESMGAQGYRVERIRDPEAPSHARHPRPAQFTTRSIKPQPYPARPAQSPCRPPGHAARLRPCQRPHLDLGQFELAAAHHLHQLTDLRGVAHGPPGSTPRAWPAPAAARQRAAEQAHHHHLPALAQGRQRQLRGGGCADEIDQLASRCR